MEHKGGGDPTGPHNGPGRPKPRMSIRQFVPPPPPDGTAAAAAPAPAPVPSHILKQRDPNTFGSTPRGAGPLGGGGGGAPMKSSALDLKHASPAPAAAAAAASAPPPSPLHMAGAAYRRGAAAAPASASASSSQPHSQPLLSPQYGAAPGGAAFTPNKRARAAATDEPLSPAAAAAAGAASAAASARPFALSQSSSSQRAPRTPHYSPPADDAPASASRFGRPAAAAAAASSRSRSAYPAGDDGGGLGGGFDGLGDGFGAGGSGAGGRRGGASQDDLAQYRLDAPDDGGDADGDAAEEQRRQTGVMQELRNAWLNERMSPVIQPFEEQLVLAVSQKLELQQAAIDDAAGAAVGRGTERDDLQLNLRQMDLDRAAYVLAAYYRTRLRKIEAHGMHILLNTQLHARLSAAEQRFLERYLDLVGRNLSSAFLNHIDPKFHRLDEAHMVSKPRTGTFVYAKVLQDVGEFSLSPEHAPVRLDRGQVLAVPFAAVEELVRHKVVQLL